MTKKQSSNFLQKVNLMTRLEIFLYQNVGLSQKIFIPHKKFNFAHKVMNSIFYSTVEP